MSASPCGDRRRCSGRSVAFSFFDGEILSSREECGHVTCSAVEAVPEQDACCELLSVEEEFLTSNESVIFFSSSVGFPPEQ
ncbi:hypothetical protein A2U01_0061937 [Trifolium medium]|uniref:Uncharacterized protein n=1 Tax=Trifolium medium TaxID=97028 RepID=A0A392RXB0_9FABA|nr:hypothetical protein [Trifolium medium]